MYTAMFMNHGKNVGFNFSRYGAHRNRWCAKFYCSRM